MSKINTKVIVFDQGNTILLDPFYKVLALKQKDFQKILDKYDVSFDSVKAAEAWAESNKLVNYPYITHFYQEIPIVKDSLERLRVPEEIQQGLSQELLKEYRNGYKCIVSSDPRNIEVKNTLERLLERDKRLGVFSSDRTDSLNAALNYMEIADLFEYVVASESVKLDKPNTKIFTNMLDYFETPAHLSTYVGDDPARDIEPSKSIGMNAILYRINAEQSESWRNYNINIKHEPDAIINNFSEILDVVE